MTPPESSQQIHEGRNATYIEVKRLPANAHGQAVLAKVVELKQNCPDDLCKQLGPGMLVVLKFPQPPDPLYTFTEREDRLNRITRELEREYSIRKLIQQVQGCADIYDIGDYPMKLGLTDILSRFVVFQHIAGKRLDKFVEEVFQSSNNESISAKVFFSLARQLATSLGELHRRGLVHGDIWPRNIIISDEHRPVFIDYGQSIIRKEVRFAPPDQPSHAYLAPEGHRSVEADVYSLCATLFYIATFETPPSTTQKNLDDLKESITQGLRRCNPSLYETSAGIADIISGGLRLVDHERTPHTERLLQNIDLFDRTQSYTKGNLIDDCERLRDLAPQLFQQDPLFGRMAGRRIRELGKYLQEMLEGTYDVRGDHDEIVMMASEFLAGCEPGDLYLTVSTPWLWFAPNLGIQGRFLSVNKDIVKRGVTVRRIFLITEQDLQDSRVQIVLAAQKRFLDEIDSESSACPINTKDPEFERGGIFTGIKLTSEKDREKRVLEGSHNGIWIRGDKSKIAYPDYAQDTKKLCAVFIRPGDAAPQGLRDTFGKRFLSGAQELRDFLDTLPGKATAP